MKVIFLEIDGVLNNNFYNGVADTYLELLKKIVDSTGTVIVLNSSWNEECVRGTAEGVYLHNRFYSVDLEIMDYTNCDGYDHRDEDIQNWLNKRPDVDAWIILDCMNAVHYTKRNVVSHLLVTNPQKGLCEDQVQKAIDMLNG